MATLIDNLYTLSSHLVDAYNALEAKGATMPEQKNAAYLNATIDTLPNGYFATDLFNKNLDLIFTGLTAIPDEPITNQSGRFKAWRNIKSVSFPDLVSVGSYGCHSMFNNCTSLTSVLSLPATTLAQYCYNGMFSGCSSLTSIPELPATTLADNCYSYMFYGCTGLTGTVTIPILNINTSIATGAFQNMFQNCSNLTKVIFDFSTYESVPGLNSVNDINVFNNTSDNRLEIHVPSLLENTWKTSLNWSAYASHISGV